MNALSYMCTSTMLYGFINVMFRANRFLVQYHKKGEFTHTIIIIFQISSQAHPLAITKLPNAPVDFVISNDKIIVKILLAKHSSLVGQVNVWSGLVNVGVDW